MRQRMNRKRSDCQASVKNEVRLNTSARIERISPVFTLIVCPAFSVYMPAPTCAASSRTRVYAEVM